MDCHLTIGEWEITITDHAQLVTQMPFQSLVLGKKFLRNFTYSVSCYDSFYAQFYKNITLENFQSNNLRRAGGLFALSNGKFILYPNNEYKEFTFKNAIEVGLVRNLSNMSIFFLSTE